ncbi:esterase/lipase family protein [Actinocrispum wychmicini]|uniref:Lecithin:cholesterol acyltransferase n=1 Tax=Actinocrispum wychmicini TaxID=1213861 RepID=A0A4R2J766_9PSEU|nr:hypothetical protein [Actinocrispum wychmicini]TCO54364.1 lecithin:cholesterol acyltransferase [Actinocrispum wychmicini]
MRAAVSQDAVVIVPGIMGSRLVETATGRELWGLRDPRWYVSAWSSGAAMTALRLTEDERNGRVGRVTATGLLRFPAFAPVLAGFEPYTKLVDGVRGVVADSAAILEFGYDWRLPVADNAIRLAEAANRHLERWRANPRHAEARAVQPDGRSAQLVLVAHSMGGLLVRALSLIPGATANVRASVTLGTPFEGAAKAAVMLNDGRDAPITLPRRRLRDLARTLPGVHDLLPTYRCVDDGDDVRRLEPSDVERLGGDYDLAVASRDRHTDAPLPGHRALMGVEQPTVQSLTLKDGVVEPRYHTFRVNSDGTLVRDESGGLVRVAGSGDGTVPRNSAELETASPLAQQHGALARTAEAVDFVRAVITGRDPHAARLGDGDFGMDVPDVVQPDCAWTLTVTGVDSPRDAVCSVVDTATGAVDQPPLHRRSGAIQAAVTVPAPGLYRVSVAGGGGSPVTQLVLAADG